MSTEAPECMICLGIVRSNLQCNSCLKSFCGSCLKDWLKDNGHSCPACRTGSGIDAFTHNTSVQQAADRTLVICEAGCGVTYAWGDREDHAKHCPEHRKPCPFSGCTFRGCTPDVDMHITICPIARSIKLSQKIQALLDAPYQQSEPLSEQAIKNLVGTSVSAPRQPAVTANDVQVHQVSATDTLQGLALRYDTTREHLRQLNHISRDAELFAFPTILVPARKVDTDGAAAAKEEPAEEIPLEALLALRKRGLIRTMMHLAKVDTCEAVSYLFLNEYNLYAAIDNRQDDLRWEQANIANKPKTFQQFLAHCNRRLRDRRCHGCCGPIQAKRRHCTACGCIFCHVCIVKHGECVRHVPKLALGVTSPDAREEPTTVCNACFGKFNPAH